MSSAWGWTTWDPASVSVWEHLPSGMRCQLVLQDRDGQTVVPTAWTPVEDYLPVDGGHSLAHLVIATDNAEIEIECGGQGDVAACRINQVKGDQVQAHWEVAGSQDGWQVQVGDTEVAVAPQGTGLPDDITAFLDTQRQIARAATPHGGGLLGAPLEAMEATLAANTFVLPQTGEILTVSRHVAELSGEWVLPNWQAFLTALGVAFADPGLAIENCKTALRHLVSGSLLGAEATAEGVRADISNPPVAAYSIWKIFQMTGDTSLLNDAYPVLLRWHDWWLNFRDGNHNNLLSWASPDETGMPGHPLYETAAIDEKTGIMQLDDVGLCSLWALDAFALMRMALQLNDLDQATHLENEIINLADRMNLWFWDQDLGQFRSRTWDGLPTEAQSITSLLALPGRIPTLAHVQRLVNEHLNFEFNTQFVLPTVGSGDPAFGDQLPWRGRISPLMNYLICEGLRHFGKDDWAETITLSGLKLISESWKQHQVFGSYNAISGRGDDLAQDPLAPEGMLFSALGVGMLIDVEPWNGMRFGNLCGAQMSINGFHLHGTRYSVSSSPKGIQVKRDGSVWLETDHPVIIRNLSYIDREISLQAKVVDGGLLRLRIHGYIPGQTVSLKVNGTAHNVVVGPEGIVEDVVDVPPPSGMGGPGRSKGTRW